MDIALNESAEESLRIPWILDAGTAIKLLYGHQAGAGTAKPYFAYLLDRQHPSGARCRGTKR